MREKKTPRISIRISIAILAVLLIVVATLPVASATTTTIQPSNADSYMYQWISGTNYGGYTYIEVKGYSTTHNERGIIRFDISSIPSEAQVTSATLKLYLSANSWHAQSIGVHRVTQYPSRDWVEDQVTWTAYKTGSSWSSGGGDFNSTATDTVSIGALDVNEWKSWDVTYDVKNFTANPSINFGWILKDTNDPGGAGEFKQFNSKEHTTASLRPKLEVTYRLVTSCDSAGVEVNQFAPGESVYVKAEGLDASTAYKIWLQDNPVNEGDSLIVGENPSSAVTPKEVNTDVSGNFGATLIWAIPGEAPVTHHEYDIVVNKGTSEEGQIYNAADDGLDSATVAGIVAPVPDVSSLILFASGLVLVALYFVYGRRKKEEKKK